MEREAPTNEQSSGLSGIVVSGDPLASRILALLLRDSGYRAESLPVWSLNKPGALEDIELLLLTPTGAWLSTEEHKGFLASLREMTKDTGLIIMELVTPSEERHAEKEEAQEALPSHKVFWPCLIDELEQRIEAALRTAAR